MSMDSRHEKLRPATQVVALGRPQRTPGASVNVGVELSSTFVVAEGSVGYGRSSNATWEAFEQALGVLEGGAAVAFSSGMAAIAAAASLTDPSRPIVSPTTPYNATTSILREVTSATGAPLRLVDMDDTETVLAAIADAGPHADGAGPAGLVWLESPTNPLMQVCDLPPVIAAAKAAGAIVMCDNTFATPLLQQPLTLGADVVVHSATKYLSGHSDLLLGVAVVREGALDGRGGSALDALRARRTLHGAVPGPFETWLALRGLRTLDVRLSRASDNAAELARRLEGHPGVARVRYPGFGAMLSIDVAAADVGDGDADRGARAEREAADRVVEAVTVWLTATSLGGVESLMERRRRYPGESTLVPEGLLRLSVGIEDVEDLWADLDQALRTS